MTYFTGFSLPFPFTYKYKSEEMAANNIETAKQEQRDCSVSQVMQRALSHAWEGAKSIDLRLVKNVGYVNFAGWLSFVGSSISGIPSIYAQVDPLTPALVGSLIQAIGNGASTYFPWDTGEINQIEKEISKIEEILNQYLFSINEIEGKDSASIENSGTEENNNESNRRTLLEHIYAITQFASLSEAKKRLLYNGIRVLTSAGLTGAGGLITGLPVISSPLGIVVAVCVGSLLSAIGNGASTYLAWDNGKITELKNKVLALNSELDTCLQTLGLKEPYSDIGLAEWMAKKPTSNTDPQEENARCMQALKEKIEALIHDMIHSTHDENLKNWLRVLVASGLSGAGGIVSGLPQIVNSLGAITAVVLGSALGGIGNGASTYLAWDTGDVKKLQNALLVLHSKLKLLESAIRQLDPEK